MSFKDKKRRRGAIEKRRRDRINNCLLELRRLVPQAIQKESSEKLEKAEILHLTVEYLRDLNTNSKKSKKGKHFRNDLEHTDFVEMGFRDCMSEVSQYMIETEGFDLQHPFRLRLLSHLKCFSFRDDLSFDLINGNSIVNDAGKAANYIRKLAKYNKSTSSANY